MTATLHRRAALSPLAAPTAAMAIAGALVVTAGGDDGIVLCPFRRCTGGYCPGCGATRATHQLLRGDLGASWSHHPWVVLAAVQAAVIAVVGGVLVRGNGRGWRRLVLPALVANSVLLLVIWAARLWTEAIPTGVF